MRILVASLFLTFFLGVNSEYYSQFYLDIITSCRKEFNLTPDAVLRMLMLISGPRDRTEGCFVDCVLVGAGLLKDNEIVIDEVMKVVPEEILDLAEKVFAKCSKSKPQNPKKCETAAHLANCYIGAYYKDILPRPYFDKK